MRKFIQVIIAIALCITSAIYVSKDIQARYSGSYSLIGGSISQEAEKFILEEFSNVNSPQELSRSISQFAFCNFVYDLSATPHPQYADIDRFIYEMDFHGVCFEFAAFVKNVFCVIAENKGWGNTKCYLISGYHILDGGDTSNNHSWNCIAITDENGDATLYNYDLTIDLTRYKKEQIPYGLSYAVRVSSQSNLISAIKEHAKNVYPSYNYYNYT